MEANVEEQSKTPLISVIVPIYNVEKYVRKCLESLKSQTMRQIEVICIDDGSTDGSGRIADEYCNTDDSGNGDDWPLFRVIHTENRGLSAARNRGIDEARAEWLMFVDSDDWVEDTFCEIPYKAGVNNDADLVVFSTYKVSKNGKILKQKTNYIIDEGEIDEYSAIMHCGLVAWNKLYKRDLFGSIRYPEGRVHEEIAITHKIIHKAKKMLLINEKLYFYRFRNNSISNMHSFVTQRDYLISEIEKYNDLISYGYPEEVVKRSLYAPAIGFLARSRPSNEDLYLKALEIINSIQGIPRTLKW